MNVAEKALQLWGMNNAKATLIAARENAVYRVDGPSGRFALRLHRQGYRTDSQLAAELDWMASVKQSGLSVPAPVASHAGPYLQHVGGVQVDVLTWLDGETLETVLPTLEQKTRCTLFHQLGVLMARLHKASDEWSGASSCDRPRWDENGLLGETPLWDRFWDNPGLTSQQRATLMNFRERATTDLKTNAVSLDFGLIHADLVPGNVMSAGEDLHLIDFDDGGYGFRLFEIATALLKHQNAPDFPKLQAALIQGYLTVRFIDIRALPLFFALRAATYVGWNITRMNEDASGARNDRFIAQAETAITKYLEQEPGHNA